MNERAWLQARNKLVNNAKLILAGFLALSVTACSQGEPEPGPEPPQSDNAKHESDIALTAIWGSEPLGAAVKHLAVTTISQNQAYVLAALADDSIVLVDLDGAIVVKKQLEDVGALSNGDSVVFDEETVIYFPSLINGAAKLIIAAPSLQAVTVMEVESGSETFKSLCNRDEPGAMTAIPSAPVQAKATGSTDAAQRPVSGRIVFTDTGSLLVAGDTDAMYPADACSSYPVRVDQSPDLELRLETGGQLSITHEEVRKTISIGSGLSVAAPERIDAATIRNGAVSVDYPNGLIVVAGPDTDGEHRLAYVHVGDLAQQLGIDTTPPQAFDIAPDEGSALSDAPLDQ